MKGIAARISDRYQAITLDWLGFGDSDRPALDYQPALLQQVLQAFVKATFSEPLAIIAAGHAAGYALAFVLLSTFAGVLADCLDRKTILVTTRQILES